MALETDPHTGVVSVTVDASRGNYVLEVTGGFPLGLKEYRATLSVEAANLRPHLIEVLLDTGVAPLIIGARSVANACGTQ